MSMRQQWKVRAIWLGGWLVRPFVFALRPGYRAARNGLTGFLHLPETLATGAIDNKGAGDPQSGSARLSNLAPVRRRSRILGRLFGVLLILDVAWWGRSICISGFGVFSPMSIEHVAIGIVLAGQFLIFAMTNWQARTGQPGGFLAFLSDGRNLWPR